MNGWSALDRFLQDRSARCRLRRGDADAACLRRPGRRGEPTAQRYPGIAAHLHACGPCGEDFEALLAAVRDDAGYRNPTLELARRLTAVVSPEPRKTGLPPDANQW